MKFRMIVIFFYPCCPILRTSSGHLWIFCDSADADAAKIIATQEMFLNDIVNSKLAPRTGSKVGLVKSKQTRFFLIKFKSTVDGLGPSLPLLINLIIF